MLKLLQRFISHVITSETEISRWKSSEIIS